MAFFDAKKKSRNVIIFDIGSASIGASLVISELGQALPRIIYTRRLDMPLSQEQSFEILLSNTKKTLEEVAGNLQKEGVPILKRLTNTEVVDEVVCVFSTPWTLPQTKVVEITKDEPFTVTKERVDLLMQKAKEEFSKEEVDAHLERITSDTTTIEQSITNIILNGYESENPYGNKTKNLKVVLFMSKIATSLLDDVEKIIHRIFPNPPIEHHSFALTSFCTLRDIFYEKQNYVLMDITGEVTDITIVRDHVILKTISIPGGHRTIIRNLATATGSVPREAESMLQLAQEGLHDSPSERVMDTATEHYTTSFITALEILAQEYQLPEDIYITTDVEVADSLKDVVLKGSEKALGGNYRPKIYTIDQNHLNPLATFESGAYNDIFLTLNARFVHKLSHCA